MTLKWTPAALTDLAQAQAYIAAENPRAAQRVAERIHKATHVLKDYPEIGRVGELTDTREWVVKQTPYLLVYRLREGVDF